MCVLVFAIYAQDPTGKVSGYLHESLVDEYGPELGVGSVLLLSEVGVIVRYSG
jgi:hypothetical protein